MGVMGQENTTFQKSHFVLYDILYNNKKDNFKIVRQDLSLCNVKQKGAVEYNRYEKQTSMREGVKCG